VFARPCPHAIAARREAAVHALVDGDRARAVALLREVCDEAPEEPRHRVELADMLAGGDEAEHREAEAIWGALANDADRVTSTLRVDVLERLARAAAARHDRPAVEARIKEASALPIDSNERRQIDAEVFALEHRGPAAEALYDYFFLGLPPAMVAQWAVVAEPELGFAHYLLGLQLSGLGLWPRAAEEIDRALELGLPGPQFVRNAGRRLAVAAYRSHDRPRIGKAIATLSGPDMTTPDHLLAQDWQARLDFDAKR
jgi:hypothetical protein